MPFTIQIALGALAVALAVGGFLVFESKRLDKIDAREEADAAQRDAANG